MGGKSSGSGGFGLSFPLIKKDPGRFGPGHFGKVGRLLCGTTFVYGHPAESVDGEWSTGASGMPLQCKERFSRSFIGKFLASWKKLDSSIGTSDAFA